MSEATADHQNPTLFFVKNLNHQFSPVEKFLKKRGYNVVVETDVKTAIERIIETNPDYIFLAWDHKNENIRHAPKTIYQSCAGQIVPFIMSTARDQIIQLESSGFENKLYPPLSGPAIQRVISKNEKKNQAFQEISKKGSAASTSKKSDMIQVKSFFTAEDDGPGMNINRMSNRNQAKKFAQQKKASGLSGSIKQAGVKGRLMSAINETLDKSKVMTTEQKQSTTGALASVIENAPPNGELQNSLMMTIDEELGKVSTMNNEIRQMTKDELVKIFEEFGHLGLSEGQVLFLDQSFNDTVKPEMFDVIEAYAGTSNNTTNIGETTQVYVMVIQELEWTGYLTVASESDLDVVSAQVILNNWIKQMIRIERVDATNNEQDIPDSVLFEMRVPKVNFAEFCSYKADFYRDIVFEDKKTVIGFFSFTPQQVINSIHENFDLLELPTEFLQPNSPLPFDVNLYLPENKKFILYQRPGSFLDTVQVQRLQNRKVEYIYSTMDYEQQLLKYKAEFNVHALIRSYTNIKGPS